MSDQLLEYKLIDNQPIKHKIYLKIIVVHECQLTVTLTEIPVIFTKWTSCFVFLGNQNF